VAATEKHYTVQEVAALWHVDESTVRKIFSADPSVLRIGHKGSRDRRPYVTLRIPQSTLDRKHQQLRKQ
jgi:hypothetical protein